MHKHTYMYILESKVAEQTGQSKVTLIGVFRNINNGKVPLRPHEMPRADCQIAFMLFKTNFISRY